MVDKAAAQPATQSYVDSGIASDPAPQKSLHEDGGEARVRQGFGDALLFIMIAADIAFGFLVGLVVHLRSDHDFSAWRELKHITKTTTALEELLEQKLSLIETVQKRCMAGILRALSTQNRRKPPYHKVLPLLLLLFMLCRGVATAQRIQREEA